MCQNRHLYQTEMCQNRHLYQTEMCQNRHLYQTEMCQNGHLCQTGTCPKSNRHVSQTELTARTKSIRRLWGGLGGRAGCGIGFSTLNAVPHQRIFIVLVGFDGVGVTVFKHDGLQTGIGMLKAAAEATVGVE